MKRYLSSFQFALLKAAHPFSVIIYPQFQQNYLNRCDSEAATHPEQAVYCLFHPAKINNSFYVDYMYILKSKTRHKSMDIKKKPAFKKKVITLVESSLRKTQRGEQA